MSALVVEPLPVRQKRLMNHCLMEAFMGTAQHLVNDHGVPADQIDRDDKRGLAADHLTLHGARVRADGSVDWTMSLLTGDPL